ncbi:MAG: glycerol-3-phosphate O-acyltransferase, partial [Myxococcota bacterium]
VRELSGGNKDRENVGQLLGAAKVLRERFGRVYLGFDTPISLRAFLEDEGVDIAAGWESPAQKRLIVKRLAYRVLGGINHVAVATATSVVAAALLTSSKRGLSLDALVHRVGTIVDYLLSRGAPLASGLKTPLAANRVALEHTRVPTSSSHAGALHALTGNAERAQVLDVALRDLVVETAELFVGHKQLSCHSYQEAGEAAPQRVYQVPSDHRIDLDYYKNNLGHHFANEGILASALLRCLRTDDTFGDRLRKEALFLSDLLKLEYVFGQELTFEGQYVETLRSFEQAGLLTADRAARVVVESHARPILHLLASMVMPVIEGYFVVAHGTAQMTEPIEKGELREQLQTLGERMWREGRLRFREAVSSVVFDNGYTWLTREGYLTRSTRQSGRKVLTYYEPGPLQVDHPTAAAELAQRLETFLMVR